MGEIAKTMIGDMLGIVNKIRTDSTGIFIPWVANMGFDMFVRKHGSYSFVYDAI